MICDLKNAIVNVEDNSIEVMQRVIYTEDTWALVAVIDRFSRCDKQGIRRTESSDNYVCKFEPVFTYRSIRLLKKNAIINVEDNSIEVMYRITYIVNTRTFAATIDPVHSYCNINILH